MRLKEIIYIKYRRIKMIPSNIKNKLEGMERRSILRSNTKLEITGLFSFTSGYHSHHNKLLSHLDCNQKQTVNDLNFCGVVAGP